MRYLFLFSLLGCSSQSKIAESDNSGSVVDDFDSDGYSSAEDCDDSNSQIYPGATEICDGSDNNCDGNIDEGVTDTFFGDGDGDGFGNADVTIEACEAPQSFVSSGTDCDDTNSNTFPGGVEICDEEDNNCDGQIDEGIGQTFYIDADGDGFGFEPIDACDLRIGLSAVAGDCNDTNSTIAPGAQEACDGVDNDCDGTIDEEVTTTFYLDSDEDGYGDIDQPAEACSSPIGYVENSSDCNDVDSLIYPNALELCDNEDNDCDGQIDEEGSENIITWYADFDGDGYGNINNSQESCSQPSNYVLDSSDCNDSNDEVSPSQSEICNNNKDDNCDGQQNEIGALQGFVYYADADSDGYGDPNTSQNACSTPIGYVATDTDCNDNDEDAHPGAQETCDGEDNDCDGTIDEGAGSLWYADTDSDGFGSASIIQQACSAPTGYVALSTDCDDGNADISPNADELCDGIDNNCDGSTDGSDAIDETLWYEDVDTDGYGDIRKAVISCSAPSGYVGNGSDCNDAVASTHPNAVEQCNDIDDDCDGDIDEAGSLVLSTYYADLDGDGYGNINSSVEDCAQPTGYVSDSTDCDDQDNDVYPQAQELCNNEDDDCDGVIDEADALSFITWYQDLDGDGYGNDSISSSECTQPVGYVPENGDCNDNDDSISPAEIEICDEIDNDCDGTIDNNLIFGSESTCPGVDCADIISVEPSLAGLDGVYWIDPTGFSPFEAYCDMSSDGGGWTLLGSIYGGDGNNWNTKFGYWSDTNTLGSVSIPFQDFKSPAWNLLNITGSEVLWVRRYDGVNKAKAILAPSCQGGKSVFRDIFTSWDTSISCGLSSIDVILSPSDATGLNSTSYIEGTSSGLGGGSTNGWCWNGGDSNSNTFQGHAGWNQFGYNCYDAGHLGYIAVFANFTSQYSGIDIDTTNWLYGVSAANRAKTTISFFAR